MPLVYQVNFPQRYSSPLWASIGSVCTRKCSNGHNMRFAKVFQQNGLWVERCVDVSKENSAISLFDSDIYRHFLR
jgi:hypothetical protein